MIFTKIQFEDFCLNFYLKFILEFVACFGRPAYRFVDKTGHFFRSEDIFASTIGQRGVLKSAMKNLRDASCIVDNGMERYILKEYLKFESRFALENIWIRRDIKKYILGAFKSDDVEALRKILLNRQFIITTLHTSAMYTFVALIKALGYDAPFVVMNPLAEQISNPSPFQRVLFRLFPKWSEINEFIFLQDGDVMKRCGMAIEAGKSLIIAPDTPFHSNNNVELEFMGQKIGVASGVGFLSKKYKVDVLSVAHWAENSACPYKLDMAIIKVPDITLCMQSIFNFFQKSIERNPACWSGWLYWEQMDHREEVYENT